MDGSDNIPRWLQAQADAARALIANIRDIAVDDEVAKHDAIEGETSLLEAIDAAVQRIATLDTHILALDTQIDGLKKRSERFARQRDMLRAAVQSAMNQADLPNLELASATLFLASAAPSAIVTQEADIPSEFFTPQPPKLDRRRLLAELKKGPVAGATLSNGSQTLHIKKA